MGQGVDSELDITEGEVLVAIRKLKTNKALGGSWLSADLFKQIPD